MKTIKLFFCEAKLWQIFVVTTVLFSLIMFMVLWGLIISDNVPPHITMGIVIKVSIGFGLFSGLLFTSFNQLLRKSEIFWETAHKLEEKIDSAEDKDTLDFLFNNDFQKLRELSAGGPHHDELRKLHTIMKTKYKYVK